MSTKESLIQKLKEKKAHVAILGLGYVGLPLAVVFAEAGFHVTGVDPDSRKIDSLTKGISYIPDVKTDVVARLVKSGYLTSTTDFSVLKDTHITERVTLQLRSEFFNLFNNVNFNNPNTNRSSGNFGRITSAQSPRILQFGAKILF